MSAADDDVQPEEKRGPGRPRKIKKADPLTGTIRVSLEVLDDIERYREKQIQKSGQSLPKKDLIETAWTYFATRRAKAVDLSLLTGDERSVMSRIALYLTSTAKSAPPRKLVVAVLTALSNLTQYLMNGE